MSNNIKRVYYAGKVRKNDWRTKLYPKLKYINYNKAQWEYRDKDRMKCENIIYMGPYFIGCDHGCYHGDGSHGVGLNKGGIWCGYEDEEKVPIKKTVLKNCLYSIESSDIVFVYIDSVDCYGTLAEIGYAKALKKEIFMAINHTVLSIPQMNELWFAMTMADILVKVEDEIEAHEKLIHYTKTGEKPKKPPYVVKATNKQLNYMMALAVDGGYIIKNRDMTLNEASSIISFLRGDIDETPECFNTYLEYE